MDFTYCMLTSHATICSQVKLFNRKIWVAYCIQEEQNLLNDTFVHLFIGLSTRTWRAAVSYLLSSFGCLYCAHALPRKAAGYDSIDVSKLPGEEVLERPGTATTVCSVSMCACVCIVVYCEISIQNIWLLQGIAVPVVTQVNLMRLSWLEWMAKQKCTRWSCLLTGCLCCHLLVVSGMVLKEDGIKYVYLKLLLEKI